MPASSEETLRDPLFPPDSIPRHRRHRPGSVGQGPRRGHRRRRHRSCLRLACSPAPASATSPSSIAISSSPPTCSAKSSSTRPTPAAALPKAEAARRKIAAIQLRHPRRSRHRRPGRLTNIHAASAPPPTSCSTAPTTSKPATSSTTTPSSKPCPGSTPEPSAPTAATMTILPRPSFTAHPSPRHSAAAPTTPPTACLACLFPAPPTGAVETCDTAGILAIGRQPRRLRCKSLEALKLLTGQPHLLRRTFFSTRPLDSTERSEISNRHPQPGLPRLRPAASSTHLDRRCPPSYHSLRPQLRTNSRASPAPGPRRRSRQTLARSPRRSSGLRSNALLLRFTPRRPDHHHLPRRPRPHPGHHRPRARPNPLRPLHRLLTQSMPTTPS